MEGGRFPVVDSWETYVSLTPPDGTHDLIDCLWLSGLWKEHSMVSPHAPLLSEH